MTTSKAWIGETAWLVCCGVGALLGQVLPSLVVGAMLGYGLLRVVLFLRRRYPSLDLLLAARVFYAQHSVVGLPRHIGMFLMGMGILFGSINGVFLVGLGVSALIDGAFALNASNREECEAMVPGDA